MGKNKKAPAEGKAGKIEWSWKGTRRGESGQNPKKQKQKNTAATAKQSPFRFEAIRDVSDRRNGHYYHSLQAEGHFAGNIRDSQSKTQDTKKTNKARFKDRQIGKEKNR